MDITDSKVYTGIVKIEEFLVEHVEKPANKYTYLVLPAVGKAFVGIAQTITVVFAAIVACFYFIGAALLKNKNHKNEAKALLIGSAMHFYHGLSNIVSGTLQSIPVIGAIGMAILERSMKRYDKVCHIQAGHCKRGENTYLRYLWLDESLVAEFD